MLGKPVHLSSQGPESSIYKKFWPDLEGLAQRDVVTVEASTEKLPLARRTRYILKPLKVS
jgi:hypothetical protein